MQLGRDVELADALGLLGNAAKGLGDELARLHAHGGQRLHDARVGLFQGLHDGAHAVSLGLGQGAAVGGLAFDEVAAAGLQRHVGGHLFGAQLVFLAHLGGLGFQLGLADLALFLFHGHIGIELVLADGALVFHGSHAAGIDGVVRGLEVGLARLGLEGAGDVGRGFDGHDRDAQDLQPQRLDLGLGGQLLLGRARNECRGAQRLLELQRLHGLLDDDLGLHGHAVAQALRVFGQVFLAVARQGEVHQRGGLARCADAVGDLALHGDALEVGRHQLQHEVAVLAAHGHRDQGGGGRVVEEGLARTLAYHLAGAELHEVDRGLGLDETDAEHGASPFKLFCTTRMGCIVQLKIRYVKHNPSYG